MESLSRLTGKGGFYTHTQSSNLSRVYGTLNPTAMATAKIAAGIINVDDYRAILRKS